MAKFTSFYLLFICCIVLDLFLLSIQSNQCFNNSYHRMNHSIIDQSWNEYLKEVYGNLNLGDQILKSELTMFYKNLNFKIFLIDKNVPKLVRFSRKTNYYRFLFNNNLHFNDHEWVEVSRFNSLYFSNQQFIEGFSNGNPSTGRKKGPWGCWFHPTKGSGIFINIGKVVVKYSEIWNNIIDNYTCTTNTHSSSNNDNRSSSSISTVTNKNCYEIKTACTQTLSGGFDSYHIITDTNNTKHPSQLIICSDKCSTAPFSTTCPFDRKLRSGYKAAMTACNCSEKSPLLNCGLNLEKGRMFDFRYAPVFTNSSINSKHYNNNSSNNNNNNNINNSLSYTISPPMIERYRPILCISRNTYNNSSNNSYSSSNKSYSSSNNIYSSSSSESNIKQQHNNTNNNHSPQAISIGFSRGLTNKSMEMSRYINTIVKNDLKLIDTTLLILIDINVTSDFRKFSFSIAISSSDDSDNTHHNLINANCTIIRFDDGYDRSNDIVYRIKSSNQFISLINLKSPVNTIIVEYQPISTFLTTTTTINIGTIVYKPSHSMTARNTTNTTTTTKEEENDEYVSNTYIMKDLSREIQDKSTCLHEINVNFIVLILLDTYNPIIHNQLLTSLYTYIHMAIFISKDNNAIDSDSGDGHNHQLSDEMIHHCHQLLPLEPQLYNQKITHQQQQQQYYNNNDMMNISLINQQQWRYNNKLPPILTVTKYNNGSVKYDIVSIYRNNDVYKLRHDSIKL